MVVRLRLRTGPRISRKPGKNRNLALAVAALLWPAVLCTYVVGIWRLAADLGWAGGFGIATGLFSHWQVWLALAVVLNLAGLALNRYGHRGEMRLPGGFFNWLSSFGHRAGNR